MEKTTEFLRTFTGNALCLALFTLLALVLSGPDLQSKILDGAMLALMLVGVGHVLRYIGDRL